VSSPPGEKFEVPVCAEDFGVYVHIPFCRAVCPYCDFNVYVKKGARWQQLEDALVRELAGRAPTFAGQTVRSIYFGGGTPSLAPAPLVQAVLSRVRQLFPMASAPEITLEVDPGTLDVRGLAERRELGVTRLSLGWQSSHDRLLRRLGRSHSADESRTVFNDARAAGFDNVSIDLIFAVPGQSMDDLERDLDAVTAMAPEHVSLYALTYHEGTPFYRWRAGGKLAPIAEELEVEMMGRIEERLVAAGFVHYEVSNYGRPGRLAVHNSLYWQGARYLGVGPGAHSFQRDGWQHGRRWEGRREPNAYAQAWSRDRAGSTLEGDGTVESAEELSARQLLSERLLVGLRRAVGVDLAELELREHAGEIERATAVAIERGWVTRAGTRLVPTTSGLFHADGLAELFF
jgi:oxygen-independent coproporphyrinogen III oxidase